MKLSHIESATIPPEKVRDYLLSQNHAIDRYKTVFFRSLGCDQANWEALADDLRSLLTSDAAQIGITEYGVKYEIRGAITGPKGRTANVITAWIILSGEDAPRFVTAYPED
ncbi:MAG TPA: hypothetical protein VF226_16330 [Hyphomicrobiaceae bacterium]